MVTISTALYAIQRLERSRHWRPYGASIRNHLALRRWTERVWLDVTEGGVSYTRRSSRDRPQGAILALPRLIWVHASA
jgi:hypothetical protein